MRPGSEGTLQHRPVCDAPVCTLRGLLVFEIDLTEKLFDLVVSDHSCGRTGEGVNSPFSAMKRNCLQCESNCFKAEVLILTAHSRFTSLHSHTHLQSTLKVVIII
jgi:hypothetical protein